MAKQTTDVAVPVSQDALMATYTDMVMRVPEPESDGGLQMLADILSATTIDDFQALEVSKLPKAEAVAGRMLRVDRITRHVSDEAYDDGTGFFIVVHSVDTHNGEVVRWQTSAMTVKSKLVALYVNGLLPATVSTAVASKPTKAGYYPVNLNVHSVSN
jgi:hypothetical protein